MERNGRDKLQPFFLLRSKRRCDPTSTATKPSMKGGWTIYGLGLFYYPLIFPHPRFRYDSRYMRLLRGDILDAFENILTDLDQRSSIHAV